MEQTIIIIIKDINNIIFVWEMYICVCVYV